MGDVLDREFFVEQFRHVNERLDSVDVRLRRLSDEFHIFRDRSNVQHREISNIYATIVEQDRRMDAIDKRSDRIEFRLDLDQTEH